MKKLALCLCMLFFWGCEDKNVPQKQPLQSNEKVQIEQNDETSEVNDTNVPLPVEDKFDERSSIKPSVENIALLYAQKCALCHGKKGEKKALGNSLIIKDMSRQEFIASLKGYQSGEYGRTLAKQMKPYATMLDNAQIYALAQLIVKDINASV